MMLMMTMTPAAPAADASSPSIRWWWWCWWRWYSCNSNTMTLPLHDDDSVRELVLGFFCCCFRWLYWRWWWIITRGQGESKAKLPQAKAIPLDEGEITPSLSFCSGEILNLFPRQLGILFTGTLFFWGRQRTFCCMSLDLCSWCDSDKRISLSWSWACLSVSFSIKHIHHRIVCRCECTRWRTWIIVQSFNK